MPETHYDSTITFPPGFAEWLRDGLYLSDEFKPGDRVRIVEGYEGAGDIYYYVGASLQDPNMVVIDSPKVTFGTEVLIDAIEPYPYTRTERIERAIEDYEAVAATQGSPCQESPLCECFNTLEDDDRALLFAIIEAGF